MKIYAANRAFSFFAWRRTFFDFPAGQGGLEMLFGILALTAVGMSWTLVGVVMGLAPKKNVHPMIVQFFGAVVSILAGLVLLFALPDGDSTLTREMWMFLGFYFASGILNCIMLYIMACAMQRGPNGVIWTIIQSAMIFPFLSGIIFFNVEPKIIRIAGFLLILSALTIFGTAKDNRVRGGGWKLLAFSAFLITGLQQSLTTLPSYYEAGRSISPIVRSLCLSLASLITSSVTVFINRKKIPLRANLFSKYLWMFVGSLQFFGLIFAYLLFYPGMDAMAEHGIGNASYPLMVASCLIGFSLYSTLVIREKNTPMQCLGFICCLVGIVLICQ